MDTAKDIFDDVVWTHAAYQVGSIKEIHRQASAGKIPVAPGNVGAAWDLIDSGTAAGIWAGNLELIKREQTFTVVPHFTAIAAMTVAGVPGSVVVSLGVIV